MPNGLELWCKLGNSFPHEVVWKSSGAIYLKRLSTDEQRFSAELVYKKQCHMSVSHVSKFDGNKIHDANIESEDKDIDHMISEIGLW